MTPSMLDLKHSREWRLGVKTDHPLRPRLLPIQPTTKEPYRVRDGGVRYSQIGPAAEAQIERWYTRLHPAWAYRTGLIAGLEQASLVVLDVDDLDGAPDFIHDLDAFPWRISTRRGVHLYSWTGEPIRSRSLPYGDVKAERGYVVGWQPSGEYTEAPGFGEGQIPLWPESVLSDLLRTPAPTPTAPQTRPDASRGGFLPSAVSLPVGQRNAGLFRRLCVAAGRDADLRGDAARLTGLARWYNEGLDVPLPDSEIGKLSRQATDYSAGWKTNADAYSTRQRARQRIGVQNRRERNADRNARIVQLNQSGASWTTIARTLGVSRSTVARTLRKRGG